MQQTENLIFAGGGTGGHLYPGIAIAEDWLKRFPQAQIAFLGTERPVEKSVLASFPYTHTPTPIEPLSQLRRNPVRYVWRFNRSLKMARELIQRRKPVAVIGLGGYASFPGLRIAQRFRVPTFLLEPNAVPGRATQMFARQSHGVFVGYVSTTTRLGDKCKSFITGNPLRDELLKLKTKRNQQSGPRVLLVTGGSQGARVINEIMCSVVRSCSEVLRGWSVRHQVGRVNDLEQISATYCSSGVEADVREYFQSPELLYENVSLAVTRAGAITLSELQYLNVPAIVIPIFDSVNNHQFENAIAHHRHSLAWVIDERGPDFGSAFAAQLSESLHGIQSDRNQPGRHVGADSSEEIVNLICHHIFQC